jgi:glucosamine--fructose-6-phosphate aminotransferase (isomerizing)
MNNMISVIHTLPDLLREIVQLLDEAVAATFNYPLCTPLQRLYLTGCGDSHHAPVSTEFAFESFTGLPTESMPALQFARYAVGFLPNTGRNTNLLIGVSASGKVARTFEAIHLAKEARAVTVALTAHPENRVGRAADLIIPSAAPPLSDMSGIPIPGVRSYMANQLALLLIAIRLGEVRGHLNLDDAAALREEIDDLPLAAEKTIEMSDLAARRIAEDWSDASEFVFVGSGPNYGTAMFSAAKVLEASGDSVVAEETEEWAHLQYFSRVQDTPTFFISAGGRDISRTLEVAMAAKTIGRRVVMVAPKKAEALHVIGDRALPFASLREAFSPVIAAIPGELFAAYRSEVIGEPAFRNFGGGRNIEEGGGISRIQSSDTWSSWRD